MGLLVVVFEKGMLKQLMDIVSLLLLLLQCVLDELNSLLALDLGELDLCTHLRKMQLTTFFRSFILLILKGISFVSNSYVKMPNAHTSTDSL